jgi:hypothetical protein
MRASTQGRARAPGVLGRVLPDALAMLMQDASEYAFIGFVGAAVTAFAVVVLRLLHAAVADALVAPAVLVMAALTMSAATLAFCRAADNLQPDTVEALASIASRPSAFLRAWLPLAAGLFAAGLALRLFHGELAPWRFAIVMALATVSALYAFSRSFYAVALVTQGVRAPEAEAVATALLGRQASAAVLAWLLVLAPTLLMLLIAQISGFGPVSTAIASFVAVMSMPVAAAVMSLLFFEAARAAIAASEGGGS